MHEGGFALAAAGEGIEVRDPRGRRLEPAPRLHPSPCIEQAPRFDPSPSSPSVEPAPRFEPAPSGPRASAEAPDLGLDADAGIDPSVGFGGDASAEARIDPYALTPPFYDGRPIDRDEVTDYLLEHVAAPW